MSSNAPSDGTISDPRLPLALEIREIKTARRMRLRIDIRRHRLTLTGPPRMNRRAALDWAAQQRGWIDAQLARLPADEPLVAGGTVPFEGRDLLIDWSADRPRSPVVLDDRLCCGGPADGLARRIERFLKAEALERLTAETAALCVREGLVCNEVRIGDAGTRWGSCSSDGRIRYNWRIVMAPPSVRAYLVAHEVAHLVHLDHGPAFHALQQRLFGGRVDSARALLRRIGPRLHRIGRHR